MTTIKITPDQLRYAKNLAEKISEDKKSFGNRGKHAQKSEDKKITFIGFLGETIYADQYNLERPELKENANDEGYDFEHPETGEQTEIKTSRRGKDLIFFPEEVEDLPPRLVRIYINLDKMKGEITLDISKKQFKENYEITDLGYGKRAFLSHDLNL